mgnify:CR=1 FL=1
MLTWESLDETIATVDQEGKVTVTGGSAVAETVDGVITIKVENRRTADLSIYKCDETGKRLVKENNKDILKDIAKINFKNTEKILND